MPKRLTDQNINTPEHFDRVWAREKIHRYDTVRIRAMVEQVQVGNTVVELGGGVYGCCQWLARNHFVGSLIVLDWSAEAKRQVQLEHPTLTYLRVDDALEPGILPDRCADVTLAGELIEHLEDPTRLPAQMARLTRPDGWMAISTLNPQSADAKRHGEYPEHLWEFTPEELLDYFRPYGQPRYRLVGNYHTITCQRGHDAKEATEHTAGTPGSTDAR